MGTTNHPVMRLPLHWSAEAIGDSGGCLRRGHALGLKSILILTTTHGPARIAASTSRRDKP